MTTADGEARAHWNALRDPKPNIEQAEQPTPGPQPAGGEGSPSIVVGQPGWQEWLERNGMNPAFDEDDAWTRRIRGY
jgi:hypothetical protein